MQQHLSTSLDLPTPLVCLLHRRHSAASFTSTSDENRLLLHTQTWITHNDLTTRLWTSLQIWSNTTFYANIKYFVCALQRLRMIPQSLFPCLLGLQLLFFLQTAIDAQLSEHRSRSRAVCTFTVTGQDKKQLCKAVKLLRLNRSVFLQCQQKLTLRQWPHCVQPRYHSLPEASSSTYSTAHAANQQDLPVT